MTIPISNEEDEPQHRPEPPVKNPRDFTGRRDDCADNCHGEEHEGETRERRAPHNFPIPSGALDLKTARAKKMIRVKLLRDPMRVPIPERRWNQRHRREEPQLPPL